MDQGTTSGEQESTRTKRLYFLLSSVNERARAIKNQSRKVYERLCCPPNPPSDKTKESKPEAHGVLNKAILCLEEIQVIQEESIGELEKSLKELE